MARPSPGCEDEYGVLDYVRVKAVHGSPSSYEVIQDDLPVRDWLRRGLELLIFATEPKSKCVWLARLYRDIAFCHSGSWTMASAKRFPS
jgi:hypothetical protein